MRQNARRELGRLVGGCLLLGCLVAGAPAKDKPAAWPQFRGPGSLGASSAKGLPVTWGLSENVVWKTPLPGPGTSSPIIVGDRIYLTCYTGYNVPGQAKADPANLRLHVVCLDAKGKIVWNKEVSPKLPEQPKIREEHGYASSTPASDGERLFVFFGKSGVFAFDLDGNQQWQADVGSGLSDWGSGTSPVLYKDLVLINASVESKSLVALNKQTGKEVWRTAGIDQAWNTPLLVSLKNGQTELVVAMPRRVIGLDPATGKELWSCNNDITWYIAPTVVAHDEHVWSIGGRSGVAAVALKAGGRGDVTKSHRLWTGKKGSNVSSPVYHDGHLYFMNDNSGIAYCLKADDGTVVYEERIPRADQVYASALLADDKIYYVSRSGRTFVVAATPKFALLATNELGDRSTFNASPAVLGNKLLIRSDAFLYCLGSK